MPGTYSRLYDRVMPNSDIDIEAWIDEIRGHLKTLRINRGLSQREVAERVGTYQSRIAILENGRTDRLDLNILVEWAAALDARLTLTIEYEHQDDHADYARRP